MLKRSTVFCLAMLVTISAYGADRGSSKSDNRDSLEPLRIGILAGLTYGTYLKSQKEWFKEQGYEIRLIQFNRGQDEVAALAGGSIDIYEGGPPSSIQLAPKVPGLWAVGVTVVGSTDLVASKASEIASLEDLPGKTVAYPGPGSAWYALLSTAMKHYGHSIDDVNLVSGPVTGTQALVKQGRVDAAATWPPFSSELLQEGSAVRIATGQEIYKMVGGRGAWLPDGVFTSKTFASEHPEAVQAVLKNLMRFNNLARENPDELATIWAKESGAPLAAVKYGLKENRADKFTSSIVPTRENIRDMTTMFQDAGLMPKDFEMSTFLREFVHPEFAKKIKAGS